MNFISNHRIAIPPSEPLPDVHAAKLKSRLKNERSALTML